MPVGSPCGVAHDRAAVGIGRVAGDAGQAQGQRVGERHVAVEARARTPGDRAWRRRCSRRVGSACDGQRLVVPVALQDPGRPSGSVRACSPMRRARSASSRASRRSTDSSPKPPLRKWTWASLKPGTTRRPCSSTTRVRGADPGARRRRRCPPPATRPPRTASAVAAGRPLPAQTRPPRRTRSACRQPRPSAETRDAIRVSATRAHSYHLQDDHRHVVVLRGVADEARGSRRGCAPSARPRRARARAADSSTSRSRRSPNSSAALVHGLGEAVGEEEEDVAAAPAAPPPPPGSRRSGRRGRCRGRGPCGVSTRVRAGGRLEVDDRVVPGARVAHGARRRCPPPRRSW